MIPKNPDDSKKEITLKPFQREAIRFLEGPGHLLCVAQTGSGKSLIYERIASQSNTRTLLLTPLRSLARQQVKRLNESGVNAAYNSFSNGGAKARSSEPSALVSSPENLFSANRSVFDRWKPNFLVVDEAHCLWDWGEGFRPEFRRIPELIEKCGIRRSVWLTATLAPRDRTELMNLLPNPKKEMGGFSLSEQLDFSVRKSKWVDRMPMTLTLAMRKKAEGKLGVIFVQTRQTAERLAKALVMNGMNYLPYHAGRFHEEKLAVEEKIRRGDLDGVIATSAFGMGVDFSAIEWVLLFQAPPSMTALAQALGRTARFNRSGEALLYWDNEDFRMLEWQIGQSQRRKEELMEVHRFCRSTEQNPANARALLSEAFRTS